MEHAVAAQLEWLLKIKKLAKTYKLKQLHVVLDKEKSVRLNVQIVLLIQDLLLINYNAFHAH